MTQDRAGAAMAAADSANASAATAATATAATAATATAATAAAAGAAATSAAACGAAASAVAADGSAAGRESDAAGGAAASAGERRESAASQASSSSAASSAANRRSSGGSSGSSSSSSSSSSPRYLYGFVFNRQRQDHRLRRGGEQKSVVVLSERPFSSVFKSLVQVREGIMGEWREGGLEAATNAAMRLSRLSSRRRGCLHYAGEEVLQLCVCAVIKAWVREWRSNRAMHDGDGDVERDDG